MGGKEEKENGMTNVGEWQKDVGNAERFYWWSIGELDYGSGYQPVS